MKPNLAKIICYAAMWYGAELSWIFSEDVIVLATIHLLLWYIVCISRSGDEHDVGIRDLVNASVWAKYIHLAIVFNQFEMRSTEMRWHSQAVCCRCRRKTLTTVHTKLHDVLCILHVIFSFPSIRTKDLNIEPNFLSLFRWRKCA